jgi:acyl carrier protein
MNEQDILEEMNGIFQKVFNNNGIQITPQTTADDIKEWVSLTHMQLIAEIEDHFNCEFLFEEVMAFRNVGNIVSAIKRKKDAL